MTQRHKFTIIRFILKCCFILYKIYIIYSVKDEGVSFR
jgi:hypothetical protein